MTLNFEVEQNPHFSLNLDGKAEITFVTSKNNIQAFEGLKDIPLSVTVKKVSKRRSLSQNAYMWGLLNEIAIKLNRGKEAVYRDYIKEFGVFEILPIQNIAVESFISKWGKNGLGWFCENLGESKLQGYTKLMAYFGSSTYTSSEMKRVLDAVIQDCKELDINTMSISEIMLLQNDND